MCKQLHGARNAWELRSQRLGERSSKVVTTDHGGSFFSVSKKSTPSPDEGSTKKLFQIYAKVSVFPKYRNYFGKTVRNSNRGKTSLSMMKKDIWCARTYR